MSPFSVGKFLPHIAKKHCGRTFLCFRNALVERIFWIGGVSQFCQSFSSHIAEKHRGQTLLCFRIVLVSEFFWIIGVSHFCRIFFLTSPKSSWVNHSVFQKYSSIKVFWIIGLSRFCRMFLSHSAENFVEKPLLY